MKLFWGVMLQAGKSQLRRPEISLGPVSVKDDMSTSGAGEECAESEVNSQGPQGSQGLSVLIFRLTVKWQGRIVCSRF